MAQFRFSTILPLHLTLLALASPLIEGCGAEPDAKSDSVAAGTLNVPLVTETNGSVYRLNASIYVSGPTFAYLTTSNDSSETTLSTTLPAGTYTTWLQSWSLDKRGDDGVFRRVEATQLSSPSSFTVMNATTTTLTYRFETDGIIVRVGQGDVNVVFDVDEVLPVCTPFSNDCGEGSWCPPSDLTGAEPGCFSAGSVPIGEPCSEPLSCVADATCMNLGDGAVCVALCASSDVGQPCPSGGTCQEADAITYGLCN